MCHGMVWYVYVRVEAPFWRLQWCGLCAKRLLPQEDEKLVYLEAGRSNCRQIPTQKKDSLNSSFASRRLPFVGSDLRGRIKTCHTLTSNLSSQTSPWEQVQWNLVLFHSFFTYLSARGGNTNLWISYSTSFSFHLLQSHFQVSGLKFLHQVK